MESQWRPGSPPKMHFTFTVSAAFPSPCRLLPEEVACSQTAPEDVFSDLLRATGDWPSVVTPAPSFFLKSLNGRAWHFDSGRREPRGFRFTTRTATPETDATELFVFSQWIKVSLCVSKHKPHAHSLPAMYLHRNWVHYIFLAFFFFFKST